ncbi:MAG TPA: M20 family metallopeptidase [Burkholderiales bacterium]|nr:M20 family metallopeptidase [Burkholderiales bacterium]
MPGQDAISLTRDLLRFDTINPPGRERDCARMAGALLEEWGFRTEYHEYADSRTSVVARLGGSDKKAPLCLTGHLDVVPLGSRKWSRDPFAGEADGDKLYGRGVSDMKAGVAAILLAARSFSSKLAGTPGIVIVLTAGEEGGCVGSAQLAKTQLLGKAGAMVVGEPTSNYPLVGHKGSLKFHARFKGVSAHGSMPELGVNAIYKAAKAIGKLEGFDFAVKPHAVMGKPTLNVGIMEGGNTVNAVPDAASFGVDIRTVPGMDHEAVLSKLRSLLGEAELEVFSNLKPVWTAPDEEWIQRVFEICRPYVGEAPTARTAPYMTDAANLLKVYAGAPTVVLGPGEAAMAHQTDEYASMERIRQSVAIYEALIRDWTARASG